MDLWIRVLSVAAICVTCTGAPLDYAPRSKLTLMLDNGALCNVKVVQRANDRVTVDPRGSKPGCPTVRSQFDLQQDVIGALGEPSDIRQILGWTAKLGSILLGQVLAFKTERGGAAAGIIAGGFVAGKRIGNSGHRWTVYLNRSTFEAEAQP